jgi:hypothetical protein
LGLAFGLGGAAGAARAAEAQEKPTSEPTTQDLLKEIRSLKDKVQQLESAQAEQAAQSTQRVIKEQAPKTIGEVLDDADKRSRFLQSSGNFTAGYSKGKFILQDDAGNFVLHPWLQFQPRYVVNYREDGKQGGESDDAQSGFEIRRMKVGFDGNVFTPDLTYLLLWASDRNSGNLVLEEAWARYKFGDWAVKGGQFKDPFAHEGLTSSKRLLAADRSLINNIFTGGDNFVQGVSLGWEPTDAIIRWEIAYTDGANQTNRNFQDFPTPGINANYGFAGRVEYLAFGKWSEYEDWTALGNDQDLLVFGAGVDYTEAGSQGVLSHTFDAQYETGPLGLYAAFYGRYTDDNRVNTTVAAQQNTYDWGVVGQAAYLLESKWEPFVRYTYIGFDAEEFAAGTDANDVHEFMIGANYYWRGHAAKFTIDAAWLPNGSPVTETGSGVLANPGQNEYLLQAQFQLLL